eukprot:6214146-Pleurochrysis_carterae.AAC.3
MKRETEREGERCLFARVLTSRERSNQSLILPFFSALRAPPSSLTRRATLLSHEEPRFFHTKSHASFTRRATLLSHEEATGNAAVRPNLFTRTRDRDAEKGLVYGNQGASMSLVDDSVADWASQGTSTRAVAGAHAQLCSYKRV